MYSLLSVIGNMRLLWASPNLRRHQSTLKLEISSDLSCWIVVYTWHTPGLCCKFINLAPPLISIGIILICGEEHSYKNLVATYSWSQGTGYVVLWSEMLGYLFYNWIFNHSRWIPWKNITFQWMRQSSMIILATAINRVNIWSTPKPYWET